MEVLTVEDDEVICQLLQIQLERRGFSVTAAAGVAEGRAALQSASYDIVILDLGLADGSGLDVLATLRAAGSTAHVIILSAASSEADRVGALERGADDFVVKPFSVRELTARVLAVRRRRDPEADTLLRFGQLEIDLRSRRAALSGGKIDLTPKEFDLLAFLAARPGNAFSRDAILRSVWHSASEWQQEATVTEHVSRLRSKIEADPRRPRLLVTVRGAGYRFDPPVRGDPDARTAEQSPAGVLVLVDGEIVHASDAALSLLGMTRGEELLGRSLFDLVAPPSQAAARVRTDVIAAGKAVRSQLMALRGADGVEVLAQVASSATEWNGRSARRMVLSPAPGASPHLRHLVTGVYADVSDAVVVTDLHAHVRSWNGAAERLYGWQEHEVLGRHIVDILPWSREDAEHDSVWLLLEQTGRWHGTGSQLTRDGSCVRVNASTTLIRDESGEPTAIVSVNRPAVAPSDSAPDVAVPDEDEIRHGMDRDEFEVFYQPVVAMDDERIVSVEALVRWRHPVRGLLAPGAFIGTAQRTGLMFELGNVVLEKACRQAARWRDSGADIDLSVNLSQGELGHPGLVERIRATLDSSSLEPRSLCLEVTETALVDDVDHAVEVLHRLAALGLTIAIDDFGTGWASLAYLRQFPVGALKIDGAFVAGIDRSPIDAAIAGSIISLGHELGLTVIAEGVETSAQKDTLQRLGCSTGQGYLFGRPTPSGAVRLGRAGRLGEA